VVKILTGRALFDRDCFRRLERPLLLNEVFLTEPKRLNGISATTLPSLSITLITVERGVPCGRDAVFLESFLTTEAGAEARTESKEGSESRLSLRLLKA
jgi:hypothetical protein